MTARRDEGFTLLEVLVALALTGVAIGAALMLVLPAQAVFLAQPEAVDMQQRLRGVAGALARDLAMAGAGLDAGAEAGSLGAMFAPVLPRRLGQSGDPAGAARSDAITITYVPKTYVQTATTAPVPGGVLTVEHAPNCPASESACGLRRGMTAVVFDRTARHDIFEVLDVQDEEVQLQPHGEVTQVYPPGALVAEVQSRSYYLDAASNQLRRYDGWLTDVPVTDNIVGLAFEYFGDPAPPVAPRPPDGVENCLYDASGALKPLPVLPGAAGEVVPLPLEILSDGPWCGTGASQFDADLLRLRAVRAALRVQAALPAFRSGGPDFLRPGTSRSAQRYLPDVSVAVEVWPRNLNFGW